MRATAPLTLALALSAALLASCGSSTAAVQKTSATWSSGAVALSVPKGWTSLGSQDVTLPARGAFVMGLRGTEKYGEYENLNVVMDVLANPVPSSDYADANFALMASKLASNSVLGAKTFTFDDGTKGRLRTFEGKYNASTNLKRYVQTARVCGNKAYVATFTLSSTTKDVTDYESMLKTFTCAAAK